MAKRRTDVDRAAILRDLETMGYDQVAERHDCSRGLVYREAVRAEARKNEARIQEKRKDTLMRRQAFLKDVLDATCTSDVLSYLDGLPTDGVDLFVTSPPYNMGKAYEKGDGQFAMSFYLGWLLQVVSEMARTVRSDGLICLQVGSTRVPQTGLPYPIDMLIGSHLQSMGLHLITRIVWEVPHGLTPKRRPAERSETILVYGKSATDYTFFPTPGRQPQKDPRKKAFKGPNKGRLSGHPFGAHPTNVWRIANVGHNHPDRKACGRHPAPFPEQLVRRLVLMFSRPGALVVDPFSGSGSVQAVCRQTGRAFSGADILYEDIRQARMAQVAPDVVSLLPGVTDESAAIWQAQAEPVEVPAVSLSSVDIEKQWQLAFDEVSHAA